MAQELNPLQQKLQAGLSLINMQQMKRGHSAPLNVCGMLVHVYMSTPQQSPALLHYIYSTSPPNNSAAYTVIITFRMSHLCRSDFSMLGANHQTCLTTREKQRSIVKQLH